MTKYDDDEKASLASYHSDLSLSPSPNPLLEKISPLNIQARMAALFLCSCVIALGQHVLYSYVDGRPAQGGIFPIPRVFASKVSDQTMISFLGTQIAKLAVIFLCAAVGIANVQVFWWRLSARRMAVRQINAVHDFKEQPLNIFTWGAALTFRLITLVAVCHALLDFVSSITPGSVTVATESENGRCMVHTVDLAHSPLMPGNGYQSDRQLQYANGGLISVVARAVVAGASFAPPSPCGVCEYNLTFAAPGVLCEDVTQTATFVDAAPPWQQSSGYTVWDAQQPVGTNLLVKSRNMVGPAWSPNYNISVDDLPTVILNCSGWNATYDISVNHTVSGTNVTLHNLALNRPLVTLYGDALTKDNATGQSFALWSVFRYVLGGTIQYRIGDNHVSENHDYVAHSPLIGNPFVTGFTWQWAGNLTELIPRLMWNVNLALLSGELSNANSSLATTTVDCRTTSVVFKYSRMKLIATYAVAFGVALMCIAYGVVATRFNRRGESAGFSRTLAAYPVISSQGEQELTPETKVRLGQDGKLQVIAG